MNAPLNREVLDRAANRLSLRRHCTLAGVSRSGVYRARKPPGDNDLALMRRNDELLFAWLVLRSRRITALLRAEGLRSAQESRAVFSWRLSGTMGLRSPWTACS
jgi:putative transposase